MRADLKPRLDLDSLGADLEQAADTCDVPCNLQAVREVLSRYSHYIAESNVSIQTTTQPPGRREVTVRFWDVLPGAFEGNLLARAGHPIEQIFPEIRTRFPIRGYGIELGITHGFDKFWLFFETPVPIKEVCGLPSLPPSIRHYLPYFKKLEQPVVRLLALDFWNKSAHVYFTAADRALYSLDRIVAMITDLGFNMPTLEEVGFLAQNSSASYTFAWDSPVIQQMSFVLSVPGEKVPVHWHPFLKGFVEHVPCRANQRRFIFHRMYATRGDYFEIGIDYTGGAFEFCFGGEGSAPHLADMQ